MSSSEQTSFDAVVIGAGFSGMYMLHHLREAGFSVQVYEAGADVGGTWYWNRYPGARCDSESILYNYTFSDEILQEWTWESRYPEQPEILRYLNFVADKLDLRRDIEFNKRVTSAHYDEKRNKWDIQINDGSTVDAKYFITGVGCLSAANLPKFKGLENFQGEWYHTGQWPHEGVDFTGKRVGIIGTGSSGVQAIPVIAEQAGHLTVFQRTPQYSAPARNHPYDPEYIKKTKENYSKLIQQMKHSTGGYPVIPGEKSALEVPPEEREKLYEEHWEKGGLFLFSSYNDITVNPDANETVAGFIRSKIQQVVKNLDVAEKLMPSYYYGTKRPIIDTNYYETYNRSNVDLVDVKKSPIEEITARGLRTGDNEYELDILVFATGYDGMTGPLLKIDICGKEGISLKEKWDGGASTRTYLGIANAGFPNMFMITGPESPSVLSNMPVSIEQHVEWIGDCIQYLRENEIETIEADEAAEQQWSKHCREVADSTLFTKTESWYNGANIPGKPRGFQIYLGGVGNYRQICDDVAQKGYEGFILKGATKPVV
ncbi:flavin-containing monooxygenase [Fictibacillus fluitans]|uniref:NAD(P)/FAD-dependent oxidoreductase n=1 Tax=Fictibacillus fluitans TaxID=3058422 RepID=A0ABT8HTJ5_9BACL|nr:NAD(P)/FAD-dependent oxidoreductase [Fictibacillus sp. NE201]MDN4524107.1 NAD(P)/FAD-dependent oxidoreductase [Fictibacillus sp. NE201]